MWKPEDIKPLLTTTEVRYLDFMYDTNGPRGQFKRWTQAQVIARCRNMADQYHRRLSHETGAASFYFDCGAS